jgi:HipA-like protein
MRQLCIYINERMVGKLSETEDVWSFKYDSSWVEAPDAFDLSPWLARKQLLHVDGASN